MALRMPRAQGLLPLLCALAACAATSPAAPTSLADTASGSDPWSQFANKWSPAIQAKINGLKAEVQKATDDADAARTEAQTARDKEADEASQLAQAQQQLVEEEPTERNIERRIASALVGWQVAVVFLLCLVACMAVCGHQRGAWTLKFLDPMLKRLDPAMKFILKYLNPVLKHLDPALKALSPRLKSLGLSEPFLFVNGRSDEKLKDPPGDVSAELERARANEATTKRHLRELQAWAEASVAKAQAQEGAAMQALQELQNELQRLRNPMGMPQLGNPMPLGSLGPDLMQRGRSPMPVRPTTPAGRPIKVRAQSPFAAAAKSPKGTDTPSTMGSSPPASIANPQSFQWNLPASDPWTAPAHAQANAAILQQPGMLHVNMPNRFHLSAEPNMGLGAPGAFTVGNGQR